MKITRMDRSNYFRGLLLLIRKDKKVTQPEINFFKHIGKIFGFEQQFCANAVSEILANTFIVDVPPQFSTKSLAIKFIKDGIALSKADNEIHPFEEHWLRVTAEKNSIDLIMFQTMLEKARNEKNTLILEAEKLTVR